MASKASKPWVRCASLVEDLSAEAAAFPPARQKELAGLKQEAKALDLETALFDDAARRLREENAQVMARLSQLQRAPGLLPSIGEHTEGGKVLARSVSQRDPELEKTLKARERVQAELCALDGSQRKLLNRCFSFDNRCSAFRKGGSAK